MTVTGRTSPIFTKFQIEDVTGAMRDIATKWGGQVGVTYDELDVSSFQELLKGMVTGQGAFSMTLTGPFDNTAAATASASGEASGAHLSGSLTVLEPLNGGMTPRAFGVYFGMQADWSTGDPVFGADSSIIVSDFTVDPAAQTYSCKITYASGGTVPSWGTSAITAA